MDLTELALWLVLLVVLAGALGQLVDTAVGMGFGVLSGTIMIAAGVNPAIAVGTVALAKVGSGFFSAIAHWGFGNVRWKWVLPLVISSVAGGVAGASLLSHLPPQIARIWVPIVLLGVGLLVINRFRSGYVDLRTVAGASRELAPSTPQRLWQDLVTLPRRVSSATRLSVVGSVAGVLNGVSGAYGPVATPSVMLLEGTHPRYAVGTVNLAEFFVAGAVSATLILQIGSSEFHWQLPLALIAGSALTAPIGAYLSRHLPRHALGLAVGAAVVTINLGALARAIL